MCLPSGANLLRDVCSKNKSETNSVVEIELVTQLLENDPSSHMKHIAFGSQIVDERYILNLAGKEAEN